MFRPILVCALLAFAASNARGQVTIDITDQPVTTVADTLAGAAGRTIVVVGGNPDELVSLAAFDLPWRDALDALALASNRRVRAVGETFLLDAPNRVTLQFANFPGRTVLELCGAFSGVGVAVQDVPFDVTLDLTEVPCDDAFAALATTWPELHFTRVGAQVVVTGAPLQVDVPALLGELAPPPADRPQKRISIEGARSLEEVCRRLSEAAGLVIEAAPALQLARPLTLRDAPWHDALQVVAAMCDARVEARGGRVTLAAPRPETRLIVAGASLGDVAQLLAAAHDVQLSVEDPRRPVTCDLLRFTLDEAAVAVAVVTGCEPQRVDGGWRFAARALPAGGPPDEEFSDGDAEEQELWRGPKPRVLATLQHPAGSLALINGHLHHVGDLLKETNGAVRNGVRITKVRGGVTFDANGQTLTRPVR